MSFRNYKAKLRRQSTLRTVAGDDWYSTWIGNPTVHEPEYGIHFESSGDAVPGGYNGRFTAYHPEGERPYMGHLDYNSAANSAVIADLQVDPAFQRQGVATKLFDYARRYDPQMGWSHGWTLPEGEAWRRSLPPELQGDIPPLSESREAARLSGIDDPSWQPEGWEQPAVPHPADLPYVHVFEPDHEYPGEINEHRYELDPDWEFDSLPEQAAAHLWDHGLTEPSQAPGHSPGVWYTHPDLGGDYSGHLKNMTPEQEREVWAILQAQNNLNNRAPETPPLGQPEDWA